MQICHTLVGTRHRVMSPGKRDNIFNSKPADVIVENTDSYVLTYIGKSFFTPSKYILHVTASTYVCPSVRGNTFFFSIRATTHYYYTRKSISYIFARPICCTSAKQNT